jgi:hypothetical protein
MKGIYEVLKNQYPKYENQKGKEIVIESVSIDLSNFEN